MTESEQKKKSWWHTFPGVLTGVAAIVTALTGLILALHQIGIFENGKESGGSENDVEIAAALPVPDYASNAVNIWKIGSPHRGNLPLASVPSDISELARKQNVPIQVQTFVAKDFAETFFAAFESNSAPDILIIDNWGLIDGISTDLGTFVGIETRQEVRDALVSVSGSLSSFGEGWQFLVSTSRNHKKAKAFAMTEPECKPEFSNGINNMSEGELEVIKKSAISSGYAYLTCNKDVLASISDPERLSSACVSEQNPPYTRHLSVCGVFGNKRFSVVTLMASVATEKSVGQTSLVAVLRKANAEWNLLTITDDPVSTKLSEGPLRKLAELLAESDVSVSESPKPATLITADWEYPQPESGQRFGNFVWRPSPSRNVAGEVVEFDYGRASRFFLFFDTSQSQGEQSTGNLWTTGSIWQWRVWTIDISGSVTLSESRSFRH